MNTTRQAGATPEQMLREFHASKAIHGGLMPPTPTSAIPEWVRDLRMALLTEEVRELYDAAMAGDIVGIADGIADVAYVVTGTAVAYGIPFDAVFAEVHRSNMTKVNTPSEAKLAKGAAYEPPDIAGVLGLNDDEDERAEAPADVTLAVELGDPDMITRIEFADPEGQLLEEIADPAVKRLDVAKTYRLILHSASRGRVNWRTVNTAIIERWSVSSLEWIKREAWRVA